MKGCENLKAILAVNKPSLFEKNEFPRVVQGKCHFSKNGQRPYNKIDI